MERHNEGIAVFCTWAFCSSDETAHELFNPQGQGFLTMSPTVAFPLGKALCSRANLRGRGTHRIVMEGHKGQTRPSED